MNRLAILVISIGISACASSSKPTASGVASMTREVEDGWFKGMVHPPQIIPALPEDFIRVSASPKTRKTGEFDMHQGVFWAPKRTARQYEFGAETRPDQGKDPLFMVRLSSSVGQFPGTDHFSDEDKLLSQCESIGLKNLDPVRTRWGSYPVLSVTGNRPNGSVFAMAWIGINSPDGWTIFVDYRIPSGPGHPTEEEWRIWDRFLRETQGS